MQGSEGCARELRLPQRHGEPLKICEQRRSMIFFERKVVLVGTMVVEWEAIKTIGRKTIRKR